MKTIIIAFLMFVANVSIAQDHDHHSAHAKQSTKKNEIKHNFIPTIDLKTRMEKISILMKELSSKKEDVKVVKVYGDKITDTINDIFKTCKLEPETDEAIHPLLGSLLDGASDFKNGNFESGHKKIHEAFLNYKKIFKHDDLKL